MSLLFVLINEIEIENCLRIVDHGSSHNPFLENSIIALPCELLTTPLSKHSSQLHIFDNRSLLENCI